MRLIAVLAAAFTTTLSAADPALLNLVMPDATVLAGINVQRAKTTPFGQFLLTQLPTGDPLNTFVASTGFDPRQDVVEVLMASNAQPKSGLVLAAGTFNPAKIAAALAADSKHRSTTYDGVQLITSVDSTDTGAIAFLSAGIAAVGDVASVKAAVDRRNGRNAIDPGLAAKAASFAAADAWSATIAGISMPAGDDTNNPFAGVLKTIHQASGSIVLASPVQISIEAVAANDQDATSLSDVLKFVMSMMQTNPQANLLSGLRVTADHSIVKVQLSIPEDQLEELIKTAKPADRKARKAALPAAE
jgi:hypothetical protein